MTTWPPRDEQGQSTEHCKEPTSLLKTKEIPVHAFYVRDYEKLTKAFRNIAKLTGGKSEYLDIDSVVGAELLTDVITERILHNIGGDGLVKSHRDKYAAKGYVPRSQEKS